LPESDLAHCLQIPHPSWCMMAPHPTIHIPHRSEGDHLSLLKGNTKLIDTCPEKFHGPSFVVFTYGMYVVFVRGPLTYKHWLTNHQYPPILYLQEIHLYPICTFIIHGFRTWCGHHIDSDGANSRTAVFMWNGIYSAPIQLETILLCTTVYGRRTSSPPPGDKQL
jgi:hypothetical protein